MIYVIISLDSEVQTRMKGPPWYFILVFNVSCDFLE